MGGTGRATITGSTAQGRSTSRPISRPISRPTVAIATCAEARDVDEDATLLLAALERAAVDAGEVDWSDPAVDWRRFDMVVIRSTWDYAPRRDEFVAWAQRVESVTRLANPAAVIRWNTDKHHLAELALDGVAVVPTTFMEPAAGPDLRTLAELVRSAVSDHSGFVVKPTVSAGSKDTFRHAAPAQDTEAVEAAASQVRDIHRSGRAAMVQPYQDGVDREGETGLVFFDGEFSHAFRKGPMLSVGGGPVPGLFATEEIEPRVATDDQLAVASAALASARSRTGSDLLYARVDLLPGDDGRPLLLEVELTEPSFFLHTDPASADRAASAIAAAARHA